jgi:hypothetical protein
MQTRGVCEGRHIRVLCEARQGWARRSNMAGARVETVFNLDDAILLLEKWALLKGVTRQADAPHSLGDARSLDHLQLSLQLANLCHRSSNGGASLKSKDVPNLGHGIRRGRRAATEHGDGARALQRTAEAFVQGPEHGEAKLTGDGLHHAMGREFGSDDRIDARRQRPNRHFFFFASDNERQLQ